MDPRLPTRCALLPGAQGYARPNPINGLRDDVEQAFIELAKKYDAAVWDQFDVMGGLHSMRDWEKAGLAKKDKVHFTNEGYQLLGDLLYNALIKDYRNHLNNKASKS